MRVAPEGHLASGGRRGGVYDGTVAGSCTPVASPPGRWPATDLRLSCAWDLAQLYSLVYDGVMAAHGPDIRPA